MSKNRRQIKRGFTLVELLVVIAIIGILVAIVMPAITDALTRGRLTALAANGRNIVQTLITKETEDIYISAAVVWPVSRGGNVNQGQFQHSTAFFGYMITNNIMNVSPSFFGAPGVPGAASTQEFFDNQGHNAWCIALGVGPMTSESTPVVFTRNLGFDTFPAGEDSAASFQTYTQLRSKLQSGGANEVPPVFTGNPFHQTGFVFVNKGGAAFSLFKEMMQTNNLTNVFQLGTATNDVLRPY